MKVTVVWFATGNATVFEDEDDILGPQTTILELKGLIQIRFGFDASLVVVMLNKRVLDNDETLRSLGIIDSAAAEGLPLQAHAFSESELDDDDRTSDANDTRIHEFSHDDFLKVCAMLGKAAPVSRTRIEEVRHAGAPLTRPRFLDKPHDGSEAQEASNATAASSQQAIPRVMTILRRLEHGHRHPTAELDFAVRYPGIAEPFTFWDMRIGEGHQHGANLDSVAGGGAPPAPPPAGTVPIELFFFGEFTMIRDAEFRALVQDMLLGKGYRAQLYGPCREAGCMYPLIAVPCGLPEDDAMRLGEGVFEDFGRVPGIPDAGHSGASGRASSEMIPGASGKDACSVQ